MLDGVGVGVARGLEARRGYRRASTLLGFDAPGKERPDECQGGGEEMNAVDAKRYKALAARANYFGLDRADVPYIAKEACHMSRPLVGEWAHLERLARYLFHTPEFAVEYCFMEASDGELSFYRWRRGVV